MNAAERHQTDEEVTKKRCYITDSQKHENNSGCLTCKKQKKYSWLKTYRSIQAIHYERHRNCDALLFNGECALKNLCTLLFLFDGRTKGIHPQSSSKNPPHDFVGKVAFVYSYVLSKLQKAVQVLPKPLKQASTFTSGCQS